MTRNQEIAAVILQQLGGMGRLVSFTGAKNFVAIENGVQFSIGKGARDKINKVIIKLTAEDLYDVEFGRVWNFDYREIRKVEGIFSEMLMDQFEEQTGFFLTFNARTA